MSATQPPPAYEESRHEITKWRNESLSNQYWNDIPVAINESHMASLGKTLGYPGQLRTHPDVRRRIRAATRFGPRVGDVHEPSAVDSMPTPYRHDRPGLQVAPDVAIGYRPVAA
jgi:hypothetical protein